MAIQEGAMKNMTSRFRGGWLMLALPALFSGCAADGGPAAPEALPAFEAARLQRGPCFGRCPVYSVSVNRAGEVSYHGVRDVAETGEREGEADQQALAELWRLLELRGFMRLPDYVPGTPQCGRVATDMPTLVLAARRDGREHVMRYYTGCSAAPAWLEDIARQIDAAAGTARWVEGASPQ